MLNLRNITTCNTSNGGSGERSGTIKPSGSGYGSSKITVCVILLKVKHITSYN